MAHLWFGGSFNPIHHAHLVCARAVAESMGFEKVVLVPSHQPPHKPMDEAIAPAEHRLAMCRLAVEGSALFEVDELEIQREGPSYTIDTVRELRYRGAREVNWMIGADMLQMLPRWHEPAALLAEARFAIVARPGWSIDWKTLPPAYQFLEKHLVIAPQLEISATQVRRRVASGQSIDYLTPERVIRYIAENDLYRKPAPG